MWNCGAPGIEPIKLRMLETLAEKLNANGVGLAETWGKPIVSSTLEVVTEDKRETKEGGGTAFLSDHRRRDPAGPGPRDAIG